MNPSLQSGSLPARPRPTSTSAPGSCRQVQDPVAAGRAHWIYCGGEPGKCGWRGSTTWHGAGRLTKATTGRSPCKLNAPRPPSTANQSRRLSSRQPSRGCAAQLETSSRRRPATGCSTLQTSRGARRCASARATSCWSTPHHRPPRQPEPVYDELASVVSSTARPSCWA